MASAEFIQKRIDGKKAEIEKLEKKLERIMKAAESNWENNPYYYHESDLKYTNRDLEQAKAALQEYEQALITVQEKDASRDVKVILEFLENWKQRATEYYENRFTNYYDDYKKYLDTAKSIRDKYANAWEPRSDEDEKAFTDNQSTWFAKRNGYYEKREFTNRWGKPDSTSVKIKDGEYEDILRYVEGHTFNEAMNKIKKDIEEEAKAKYDFIIERVNAICGTITDASNLRIADNGELNGIIIGERGNAKVETIGAGGYNVQKFHFRTLIKPVTK